MSTTTIADLWVQTDWATFVELTTDPAYRHAKFYYRHNWMRLEMAPVGYAPVKRELYAELGVREYWVVETDAVRVWMFAGDVGGGVLKLVDASRVLPGLSSIVLAEALHLGQSEDDAAAMRYILDLKK